MARIILQFVFAKPNFWPILIKLLRTGLVHSSFVDY